PQNATELNRVPCRLQRQIDAEAEATYSGRGTAYELSPCLCQRKIPSDGLRDVGYITDAAHRSAIGIHVGLKFVMIHAPPKAISPAYTICGSIAMSADMSPTIAPSTDWTAFNRSLATL